MIRSCHYKLRNTSFIFTLLSLIVFSETLETALMVDSVQLRIQSKNLSFVEEFKRSEKSKVMTSIAFTFLGILGITGNLLVMYAIWKEPILQIQNQLSNMPIFNLALTDLATTSIVSITAAITAPFDVYPFSHTFCRFCTFCNITTLAATFVFLAVISIDRYILIKNHGIYPKYITQFRFTVAMYCVWIACSLVALGWIHDPDWVDYDVWSGVCDVKWVMFGPSMPLGYAYGWFGTILYFVLPTSVIIYCNIGIVKMVRKLKNQIRGHTNQLNSISSNVIVNSSVDEEVKEYYIKSMGIDVHQPQEERTQQESNQKLVRAMFVVMIVYIFLTAPVGLIRIMKVLGGVDGPGEKLPRWIPSLCTILQFSASIVNPLIYGLFRKDFREAYYKIFSCK